MFVSRFIVVTGVIVLPPPRSGWVGGVLIWIRFY